MSTYVLPPGSKKYRGPSPDLWKQYDAEVAKNPYYGFEYSNDFAACSSGTGQTAEWRLLSLVGTATFGCPAPATANTVYGSAFLDPGATTATHGGLAQLNGGGFQPGTSRGIYYETLVRFAALGTVSSDFARGFIGMAAPTAGTIMSTASLNVSGLGFTFGADGVINFAYKPTSGSVQVKSTGLVATAATWYHLGFAVDRRLGVCNAWVNSVKDNLSTAVTTKHWTKAEVDLITTPLTPSYQIVNVATARATIEVDWVRAAMLGEPEVR